MPEENAYNMDLPLSSQTGAEFQTSKVVKQSVQELLKYGFIDSRYKAKLFQNVVVHKENLTKILEPLDLNVSVDEHRGVAFLKVDAFEASNELDTEMVSYDEWSHPLVRKQRLTKEQSLVVAILRQAYVMHEQELGVGSEEPAKVAVDEMLSSYTMFFGDSGSDAKNLSRLSNVLDQLKTYGVVSEVDANEEIIIRPLIAHLANPESLASFIQSMKESLSEIKKQEEA